MPSTSRSHNSRQKSTLMNALKTQIIRVKKGGVTQTFSVSLLLPCRPQGRLDLFFLFMMGLLAINTVAFLMVAISYEYKQVEHKLTASPCVAIQGASPDSSANARHPSAPPGVPAPANAAALTSSAMAIRGSSSRGTTSLQEAVDGEEDVEGGSEDMQASMEIYARSLAYQPVMPAMPAPFR